MTRGLKICKPGTDSFPILCLTVPSGGIWLAKKRHFPKGTAGRTTALRTTRCVWRDRLRQKVVALSRPGPANPRGRQLSFDQAAVIAPRRSKQRAESTAHMGMSSFKVI